ncbi:MAG TPA: hypothetical protein VFQ61_21610 [Polyangiaceae bacterium]|nr:hypothetical protein [Polyangiaceae bacterium]
MTENKCRLLRATWIEQMNGEVIAILATLTLGAALRHAMAAVPPLPEVAYRNSVIFLQALRHPGYVLALLAGSSVYILTQRGRQIVRWSMLEPVHLRWFVVLITWPLAWYYSTYDYNFYFDQTHGWDRALLVLLWLGVLASPALLLPFLLQCVILIRQFDYPDVLQYSWTDKSLPLAFACCFWAYCIVACFTRRAELKRLLIVVMAIFAAHYFGPGVQKVSLGEHPLDWALNNSLHHLFVAATRSGWLDRVDPMSVMSIAHWLERATIPLQLATLAFELGAVLVFWDRRAVLAAALGAVFLHASIFLSSGILFWKWVIVDLSVLAFVGVIWREGMSHIAAERKLAAIATLLVPLATVIYGVPLLGWHDTQYLASYEIMAQDTSSRHFSLSRQFFAPYDMVFSQNRFRFLAPQPVLPVGTLGSTQDSDLRREIAAATPETLPALIERLGVRRFDPDKKRSFNAFLADFIDGANRRGIHRVVPEWLRAPSHIWLEGGENPQPLATPITHASVEFREYLLDPFPSHPYRRAVLDDVHIPISLRGGFSR